MPDPDRRNEEREWPRRYTPAELQAIANSIAPHKFECNNLELLQEAVEAYQWGSLADDKTDLVDDKGNVVADRVFPLSTNKGRRILLKRIVRLCEQKAPRAKLEFVLRGLDGRASALLDSVDAAHHLKLKGAAESALKEIPTSGPDPKGARRQFIGALACIFLRVTKQPPHRRVRIGYGDYGPFLEFVKAALTPFKATQGCEADIKVVLAPFDRTI